MQIKDAAKQLGIGSKTLFKLLRQRGVLNSNNIANRAYVSAGYFRIDGRSYTQRAEVYQIQRQYQVTLVTDAGLSFIQELINQEEKRHEQNKRRSQRPKLSSAAGA